MTATAEPSTTSEKAEKRRKSKQATRCAVFSHFSILLLIHMLSLNHGPYHLIHYRARRGNQVCAPLSLSPHSADVYPTHPTCFPHHHLGSTSATAIRRSLPPTRCACPVHIQKKRYTPPPTSTSPLIHETPHTTLLSCRPPWSTNHHRHCNLTSTTAI